MMVVSFSRLTPMHLMNAHLGHKENEVEKKMEAVQG